MDGELNTFTTIIDNTKLIPSNIEYIVFVSCKNFYNHFVLDKQYQTCNNTIIPSEQECPPDLTNLQLKTHGSMPLLTFNIDKSTLDLSDEYLLNNYEFKIKIANKRSKDDAHVSFNEFSNADFSNNDNANNSDDNDIEPNLFIELSEEQTDDSQMLLVEIFAPFENMCEYKYMTALITKKNCDKEEEVTKYATYIYKTSEEKDCDEEDTESSK